MWPEPGSTPHGLEPQPTPLPGLLVASVHAVLSHDRALCNVKSLCRLLSGAGELPRTSKCRDGKMAQSLKQENINLDSQNPQEKARHGRAL